MPSTATITAFYTFTGGTKARATQVTNNFSLFRGHNIPIDPNTATAIDNTYDLGSTEYRWRRAYVKELWLTSGYTSTAEKSGIAATAKFSTDIYTITSTPIAGSTLTITTTGRPVEYSLFNGNLDIITNGATTGSGATGSAFAFTTLYRDGISVLNLSVKWPTTETFSFATGMFRFIDSTVTAGTYKYHLQCHITTKTGCSVANLNTAFLCKEL